MRRFLVIFLLLALALPASAKDTNIAPLRIGLFPNLSPLTLFALHRPLAKYLETALGRPVELATAPDFRSFVERTGAGDYDAVLTAPHLARLAEQDGRYEAAATYDQELRAILVVPTASPITHVSDLRGAKIAEPDPLAVVSMLGQQMLEAAGLGPGAVHWINAHSHNGAVLSVSSGLANAAVVGNVPYAQLSEGARINLRILATSRAIPNQAWLLNKRLSESQRQAFKTALMQFARTSAGRRYLKWNNYGAIRLLQPNELKTLDPFAAKARMQLEAKQ